MDNNRRPVGKVKISLRGKVVAESGNDGSFSVNLPRAESRVAITFAAEGYVSNTRVYDSRADGMNTVVVWPIAYRVKFDPSRELDIELGSSRIHIPADALTGPGGKKISGFVGLQFTLFDITSPFQRAAASGDFSRQLPDGKIQRLNSYGIFDFGVRDLKEGPLSLRNGAKINLFIAVPSRLVEHAPRQVGFFNFDTLSGMWIPVGTFDFVPSTLTYNGHVTVLVVGAHNLDNDQDTTCVTVQVINFYDGSGVPFFFVSAQGLQYSSTGITDANGFVCLLVEKNATFTVTAQGSMGGNSWGTPHPSTFTSPNLVSGAGDCGDPIKCPFLGTVPVDFITGHLLTPLPF
ncbi:MAG TPA: hypothetical protein DC047_11600 [Blastocatellia bacterium]|nr:hypothetical protein [Blastocatellia bacterium]